MGLFSNNDMPAPAEGVVSAAKEPTIHRVLYHRASPSHAWHPLKSVEKGDPDEAAYFTALRIEKIRNAIASGAVSPEFMVTTEQNGVSI